MTEAEKPHIGWLAPGQVICLGAGPVRLRYSRDEARALMYDLRALLRPGGTAGHPCGCAVEEDGDVTAGLDEAQREAGRRAAEFWE